MSEAEAADESVEDSSDTEPEEADQDEDSQPEAADEEVDEPVSSADPLAESRVLSELVAEAQALSEEAEVDLEQAGLLPSEEEQKAAEAQVASIVEEQAREAEEETVAEEVPLPVSDEPDDGSAWYVVHCYSGYENKVRHNLEQRIESMGMKDWIFDVVVPTEEEIEVKDGKRRTVERRVFPGYILVNMLLTEESWYVVRNTPGVTSFVGMGNEPTPLRPEEVSQIVRRMEADAPRIKVTFRQGERVRIIDGPFNDFRGTVDEIDMERAKVRVMVNFFGRETPVELDFLQVEKA
jgi:transcriptional antiterminator NusG